MVEKTYTLTELVKNLRSVPSPTETTLDEPTMGWTLLAVLGYPASGTVEQITDAYNDLERRLQAVGL